MRHARDRHRCGSVPEIIDDGITGFIVDDEAGAVAALRNLDRLDRRAVRAQFERRFSARRMASDYLKQYDALVRNGIRSAFVEPMRPTAILPAG